jgi:hypothetical protein
MLQHTAAVPPALPAPLAPVPVPAPVFTPMPTAVPPPSPVTPTHAPDEEEEEVEDTITPRHIQVPVSLIVQATLPRRSVHTPQPLQQIRHIQAGKGTTGEELDTIFYADFINNLSEAIENMDSDPKTIAEARMQSNWPQWKQAMDKEIRMLEKAGTWKTVPRPAKRNIVGSKWVFRIKRKADRSIDKYKVQLVAHGFMQMYGVDYFSTYSPVVKLASFRIILTIATCHDWEIESFNFVSVYLNGELDENEEIYMQSPPGYESKIDMVKRLIKSLYSLKQAGCKWYEVLVCTLANFNFQITVADPGVFCIHKNGHLLILAVHVDDCMLTSDSAKMITEFKEKLNNCYALTDLGPIHWLLGIKITRLTVICVGVCTCDILNLNFPIFSDCHISSSSQYYC